MVGELALSIASGVFASLLYDVLKGLIMSGASGNASRFWSSKFLFYVAMVFNGLVALGAAAIVFLPSHEHEWVLPAFPLPVPARSPLPITVMLLAFVLGLCVYGLLYKALLRPRSPAG